MDDLFMLLLPANVEVVLWFNMLGVCDLDMAASCWFIVLGVCDLDRAGVRCWGMSGVSERCAACGGRIIELWGGRCCCGLCCALALEI